MVAQSYARPRLQPGDEIIVSAAEHHANLVPWLMVAEQTGRRSSGCRLTPIYCQTLKASRNSSLHVAAFWRLGRCRTLPAVARIYPRHYARPCGWNGGDGGWCPGDCPFPADVQQLDIDFYAFSGHKLYGPTGIGVLYGKPELLDASVSWLGGGKMISEVSFDGFTTQAAPWKLEAGTPNVAGVIGLSGGARMAGGR